MKAAGLDKWFARAMTGAQGSALPRAIRLILGDEVDATTAVDAVVACLSMVERPSEAALRDALRAIAEPHAERLDLPWQVIADAIIAALDGAALDGAEAQP